MTRRWIAGAAVVATLAGTGSAAAEPGDDRPIAAAVARLSFDQVEATGEAPAEATAMQRPGYPVTQPSRGSRVTRAILGGAAGAVGGAFLGGYVGAKLEPDCNCDDPGFKGFLIGFPVGGVVGGILGAKYLFR